jgi:TPR repeat protein
MLFANVAMTSSMRSVLAGGGSKVSKSLSKRTVTLSIPDVGQAEATYRLALTYLRIPASASDDAEIGTAESDIGEGSGHSDDVRNETAVELLKRACALGSVQAHCELGILYADGILVLQSDAEAFRLFRIAADRGDARGEHHVGLMYATGRAAALGVGGLGSVGGISSRAAATALAVQYFAAAASKDHAPAQYDLAYCLEMGQGVAR